MGQPKKSFEEVDAGGRPLQIGNFYEVVHGPASSPERTSHGTLVDIDPEGKVYTFDLEDGNQLSVADNEIDGIRQIENEG